MRFLFDSRARKPFTAGKTDRQIFMDQAYFELDPVEETVDLRCRAEYINTIPEAVYNGRILRYDVDIHISSAQARRLYRELESLFEEVAEGFSTYRDKEGNLVGRLAPQAKVASQAIEDRLRAFDAAHD